jgi:hypothetical protein
MNTHLPADLEQFVQAKVRSGRKGWRPCEPGGHSPCPRRLPRSVATLICLRVHDLSHHVHRRGGYRLRHLYSAHRPR